METQMIMGVIMIFGTMLQLLDPMVQGKPTLTEELLHQDVHLQDQRQDQDKSQIEIRFYIHFIGSPGEKFLERLVFRLGFMLMHQGCLFTN
jgi:hypothetical protein